MKTAFLSLLMLFTTSAFLTAQPGAGYTLDYTGTSYAQAPHSASLNPTTAMSVEAWIYPTSFGLNQWLNTIVSTDAWTGPNGEEGYVLRCGDNGKLSFNIASSTSWKEAVSPALMATNQWHHVAGTFNGSVLKVYLNGVEVATTNFTGTIKASTQPLRIGRMAEPTQNREFNGQIDEVRIWNKALTLTEIRDRMCKKLAGNETGLIAYYRFDEGSGNTVADLSPNNNNLTLSSSPAPLWKGSGAHIGDTSVASFPTSWAGASLHLAHADGDSMTVSNISGSPAGVQLYLVNGSHPDSTAPTGVFGLMNDRYWGVFLSGGTTPGYKLDYDFTGYPGILSASALRLLYKTGGPTWTLSPTAPASGKLSLTANATRQYVLGTLAPQVNFHLHSPADSSQLTLQGWGAQTITYVWEKVATKTPEIYHWYFDAVGGNFNPPKAKLKSDNGGSDTTFTLSYFRMDSVLNISSLAKGQSRYFKWTVKTDNGLEAVEPFYARYTRGTIGLKEWTAIEGFEIFPTVISGESVNYHYSGPDPIQGSIEVMDVNGRLLLIRPFHVNGPEKGQLELGHLPEGTYLLKIGNDSRAFVARISKI